MRALRLTELPLAAYLEELAADSLFPSAGAAAALGAAQGAGLLAMVCRVNLRRGTEPRALWEERLARAETLMRELVSLAGEDGAAYQAYISGEPEGPRRALEVPLAIAESAEALARLLKESIPLSYPPVRADAEAGLSLALGSKKAALAVARHNLALLQDQEEREGYALRIRSLECF